MNLRFFADEGVEDPGAAEPEESTEKSRERKNREKENPKKNSDGGENSENAETAQQQTPDQNAVYASIRRQAEADAQKSFRNSRNRLIAGTSRCLRDVQTR